MPPLQKSISDELLQYYQPVYGFTYAISLAIIPATVEILQRRLAKLNILSHHKISGLLGKLVSAFSVSTIVTSINYASFPQIFQNQNTYNFDHFQFVLTITMIQFLLFYHKRILPSSNLYPGVYRKSPIKLKNQDIDTLKYLIQKLGLKNGCHTCGLRPIDDEWECSRRFSLDYQPNPDLTAHLLKPGTCLEKVQTYVYPQCKSCSIRQTFIIKKLLKKYDYGAKPKNLPGLYNFSVDCRTYGLDQFYFLLPWCFMLHFAISYEFLDEKYTSKKFYDQCFKFYIDDFTTNFMTYLQTEVLNKFK